MSRVAVRTAVVTRVYGLGDYGPSTVRCRRVAPARRHAPEVEALCRAYECSLSVAHHSTVHSVLDLEYRRSASAGVRVPHRGAVGV